MKKKKRIGMTIDPEKRKLEWERKCKVKNFRIIKEKLTYNQALDQERKYKDKGYKANPGGKHIKGKKYFLYSFQY